MPGGGGVPAHGTRRPGRRRAPDRRKLHGRRLPLGRRRSDLAGQEPRRARRVPAGPAPGVRSVRPQDRPARGATRAVVSPEPLGPLSQRRRRRHLEGHRQRRALGLRVLHGHPPADPTPPSSFRSTRPVPLHAGRQAARLPDADAGASWRAMSRGLPQKDAFETVVRDAMAVDSSRSGQVSGRAAASSSPRRRRAAWSSCERVAPSLRQGRGRSCATPGGRARSRVMAFALLIPGPLQPFSCVQGRIALGTRRPWPRPSRSSGGSIPAFANGS
jgi:hypothetical protein